MFGATWVFSDHCPGRRFELPQHATLQLDIVRLVMALLAVQCTLCALRWPELVPSGLVNEGCLNAIRVAGHQAHPHPIHAAVSTAAAISTEQTHHGLFNMEPKPLNHHNPPVQISHKHGQTWAIISIALEVKQTWESLSNTIQSLHLE